MLNRWPVRRRDGGRVWRVCVSRPQVPKAAVPGMCRSVLGSPGKHVCASLRSAPGPPRTLNLGRTLFLTLETSSLVPPCAPALAVFRSSPWLSPAGHGGNTPIQMDDSAPESSRRLGSRDIPVSPALRLESGVWEAPSVVVRVGQPATHALAPR
ncbi:unnamed protein product [Rangifer tarandus platyrhynchus]|uniref:Uncharacterized protein n=2 Tax=Rangifer tarandus platyrhynchus TaxID=3082113 RepID=A0ABN8YCF6_RANTA|nr:unnamed protein product [Rangifer tarandus platyrhynchus]CAI9699605.1 unnamed protein product [Rangifer tarandus platyrhynchus]